MSLKSTALVLKKNFRICGLAFLIAVILIPTSSAQVKHQNRQILDSLLVLSKNVSGDDSTRLALWVAIQRQYGRLNDEGNSLSYVAKIIPLARQLRQPVISGTVYNRMGLFYHGRAEPQSAEKYYLLAIDAYGDANRNDLTAGSYLNLGALYTLIPDYARSLAATLKAIEIYLGSGELGSLASCYTNIANIYVDLHQESKAMEYLDKALKIFITDGENTRGVNVVYSSKVIAYLSASPEELRKMGVSPEQRFSRSLEYLTKALRISEVLNSDDLILHANLNLGSLYEKMDNGVGMTNELVNHFNKEGAFLGGGQSTLGTRNERGTGLGLMLCRTFTDIMYGTIKVSSKQGVGTTFHLSFKNAVIND